MGRTGHPSSPEERSGPESRLGVNRGQSITVLPEATAGKMAQKERRKKKRLKG